MKYLQTIMILLLCGVAVNAANLISNGDFAVGTPGQIPTGWSFNASGNAQVTMALAAKAGRDGHNALKIVNRSPLQPCVFGRIMQYVKLTPGVTYEMRFWAFGKVSGENSLLFTFGKSWNLRFLVKNIRETWQEYSYEFTAKAEEFDPDGTYQIGLDSDDTVVEAFISDLTLMPLNHVVGVRKEELQRERIYPITEYKEFNSAATVLPDNLPHIKISAVDGKKNVLSAEAVLAEDDRGLLLWIDVVDPRRITFTGESMWQGSSIQIAIDENADFNKIRDGKDFELGLTFHEGEAANWSWTLSRDLTADELEYSIKPTAKGYFVAARLNWKLLGNVAKDRTGAFGFNFVVNGNDGNGRRIAYLANGIHDYKTNLQDTLCVFSSAPHQALIIPAEKETASDNLSMRLISSAFQGGKAQLKLRDAGGKEENIVLGNDAKNSDNVFNVATVKTNLSAFRSGPIKISLLINGQKVDETEIIKIDFIAACREALKTARDDFQNVSCQLIALPSGMPARARAMVEIVKRQFELIDRDLTLGRNQQERDYYGRRGLAIIAEINWIVEQMKTAFNDAQAGKGELPHYYYASSPRTLKDGYFVAEMRNGFNGKSESRPVIFSGFGHFDQAANDVALFPKINCNAIQIEKGPSSFIKGENPDGSFIIDLNELEKDTLPALENAWKNNVAVIFLLSPHYFPEWALKKHPEVTGGEGFILYDVLHPYSRKLIEAYLRAVIPVLKKAKGAGAIHSLCLTNEPGYKPSLKKEFTRNLFTDYLEKKYGTVGKLNQAVGGSFLSFAAAVPQQELVRGDRMYYEYVQFKMDEFAAWHAWMAGIIREIWPEVPLHAKEMIFTVWDPAALVTTAAEPERFARFSDLSGNDNYFTYQPNGTVEWTNTSMSYALQSGFKPVHIVNSENHIINDTFTEPVPYNVIYTAIFQQFMHGCAGSAIWVWEDYGYQHYIDKNVFSGNIYRRPACVLAVSDASADANRLAYEIRDFFNAKPDVSLLYSVASNVMDPEYSPRNRELFTAMAYAGRKLGYISEKQVQDGKFGDCKVIVLAGASIVDQKTVDGLAAFVRNGGRVVTYGKCLSRTPGGKTITAVLQTTKIDGDLKREALFKVVQRQLNSLLPRFPLRLESKAPSGTYGVEWRTIKTPSGEYLLNACNYNEQPVVAEVVAPKGATVRELIGDRLIDGKIVLERFKPVLIKASLP